MHIICKSNCAPERIDLTETPISPQNMAVASIPIRRHHTVCCATSLGLLSAFAMSATIYGPLIGRGGGTGDIARELDLSRKTLEYYGEEIKRRLGPSSGLNARCDLSGKAHKTGDFPVFTVAAEC
jgi:hypothetical protein